MNGPGTRRHTATLLPLLCLFAFVFASPAVSATSVAVISSIETKTEADATKIFIKIPAKTDYAKGRLSNPDRIYIDLRQSSIDKNVPRNIPVDDGLVKTIRTGHFSAGISRIVVEMDEKNRLEKYEIREERGAIVITISGKTTQTARKKIIVIDAGHGGHDPGAVGPRGLKEKDITLAVALKLRKVLEKDGRYVVHLTRDSDVFLELRERTLIANNKGADLFVSVHANATNNGKARGVETYLLNWSNDEGALKVAARENSISVNKLKEKQGELGIILTSLELTGKRDESVKLANFIQIGVVGSVRESFSQTPDLGVKQAMFFVLLDAKMPSALVEISFISNPVEEKLLAKKEYQENIAKGIAKGIVKYLDPPVKVARK